MEEEQSYKYYVVQLVDPPHRPHEHFDKYVCVPDSWIILREIADQTAVIKYPEENMSETKKRVMNNETFSVDWTIFVANVKYGTNSYKDAKNYITVLNNRLIQEQSYVEIESEGNALSQSEMKSPTSKSNLSEINKPETSGASLSYGGNLTTNNTVPNQPPITDFDLENANKTENVNEITKSVEGRRYLTRRAYRLSQMSKHEQSISTGTTSLDSNTVTPDKSTECFYDYIGKSCSQENTSAMNHDTSDLENELTSPEISRKPIFGNDFSDLLKEMYSSLENMHLMYDRISQVYLKHCSDISEMIRLVERFNNFYADPIATNSVEVTATVLEVNVEDERTEAEKVLDVVEDKTTVKETAAQRISKRKRQTVKGGDDVDSDVSDYDNFRCFARKRRGQSHKFTLPPDYEENDSRWTLRYRKKMDGLVELMPNSGVYVNAVGLSNCKKLSKDSKTLARMLIMEVFTKNALRTCSITGKKTNTLNIDKSDVRPGLDKNARTVLLNFVQQHGRENKWIKLDAQHILSSIRTTLQKMRVKDE